jgi:hypothetical protein
MADQYNDGGIPYGSQVLSINSVSYVAETIEFNQPTSTIERRNQLNVPSGAVYTDDFESGTALLQLANTNSLPPVKFDTFIVLASVNNNVNCVITEVGLPQARDQEKKVNISFRKLQN